MEILQKSFGRIVWEENKVLNEEYYIKYAQLLNEIVPIKWRRTCLCAEVSKESIATYFYFMDQDGKYHQGGTICNDYSVDKSKYQKFLSDLVAEIRKMNRDYLANQQEKWSVMTFCINSDGEFNIDFDYINLNNSDSRKRRKQWKEKYLK